METLLALAQLLALLSVSALCVYLIVVLTQFRRDFSEFNQRSRPVLENLTVITERLKSASAKIDEQVDLVKGALQSVKLVADSIFLFERRIRSRLEEPILEVASAVGAVIGSIAAFIERIRSRTR